MDVGDGGEVEVLAPDERGQFRQERPSGRDVAGAGPRLDEGRPLPVLADALIIFQGGRHRHRRRGRGGVGPQAQVHPEHIAVPGAVLHQVRQPVGQPHREALGLHPFHQRQGVGLVEHRDVDIAGIVEFEGPVLAHGDAEEAGHGSRRPVSHRGQPPRLHFRLGRDPQRGVERHVGEPGQGACDLIQAPNPAQISQGDQQVGLGLQHPQARLGGVQIGPGQGLSPGQQVLEPRLGLGFQEVDEPPRVPPRQAGEIGRGSEHRRQGRPSLVQHGQAIAQPPGQGLMRPLRRAGVGDGAAGPEGVEEHGHQKLKRASARSSASGPHRSGSASRGRRRGNGPPPRC